MERMKKGSKRTVSAYQDIRCSVAIRTPKSESEERCQEPWRSHEAADGKRACRTVESQVRMVVS
jgi:hypothetical protein